MCVFVEKYSRTAIFEIYDLDYDTYARTRFVKAYIKKWEKWLYGFLRKSYFILSLLFFLIVLVIEDPLLLCNRL